MSGFEIKVWKEPGWEEGSPLLWRAQIYESRRRAVSRIGVGPTREEAIADCYRLVREDGGYEVEWVEYLS